MPVKRPERAAAVAVKPVKEPAVAAAAVKAALPAAKVLNRPEISSLMRNI